MGYYKEKQEEEERLGGFWNFINIFLQEICFYLYGLYCEEEEEVEEGLKARSYRIHLMKELRPFNFHFNCRLVVIKYSM